MVGKKLKNIKLDFFGYGVEIIHLSDELARRLSLDFSFFIKDSITDCQKKLVIEYYPTLNPKIIPNNLIASKQSENSISYNLGNILYNDYYGEAVTVFDYDLENCRVYCEDINFSHELFYIIILSRSSKFMDCNGLNKIHACAVSFQNKNLVFMMPSKGGKTTHFCELIKNEKISIISDDTPVVDGTGNLKPFPLRLGLDTKDLALQYFPYLRESDLEEFHRKKYSKKYLISLNLLKNKIEVGSETVLVLGKRSTFDNPKLVSVGKVKMFKYLVEHMIVGIGLPMIVEYFVRNNLNDHFRNFIIFTKRSISAMKVVRSAKCYELYCSSDIEKNVSILKGLIDAR